jgi:mono/diheme cytochrome c family protein
MTDSSTEKSSSTRRGKYRPRPPEESSRAAKAVLRVEIAMLSIALAALGLHLYQKHRNARPQPVTFAAAAFYKPASSTFDTMPTAAGSDDADAAKGQMLYAQSCTTCHGTNLQGMPHQGVSLRDNKFVAATNDRNLVAFLKLGRRPADSGNKTGLLMPPRGGNPSLDDDGLLHIVAYLRQAQSDNPAVARAGNPSTKPVASVEP